MGKTYSQVNSLKKIRQNSSPYRMARRAKINAPPMDTAVPPAVNSPVTSQTTYSPIGTATIIPQANRTPFSSVSGSRSGINMTNTRGGHTASDRLENVKSRMTIGGTRQPLARCGLPNASRLLSMMTGLSLKRKFFTAYLISPSST